MEFLCSVSDAAGHSLSPQTPVRSNRDNRILIQFVINVVRLDPGFSITVQSVTQCFTR